MHWSIWILLAVGVLFLFTTLFQEREAVQEFDPETYSYRPSSAVLDSIAKGDELESIKLIRDETKLGLKEGRDLYRHLRIQAL